MARTYRLEAGLLLGLAVVALAIRLPYLQIIPAFYTDEIFDFERGFFIAQGQLFPLTNYAAYMGSLWNWLIAMAFWLSQNDLYAPRTLVLTFGVLSVLAVISSVAHGAARSVVCSRAVF